MTYVDEGPNGAHGLDGLGGLELAAEPEVDDVELLALASIFSAQMAHSLFGKKHGDKKVERSLYHDGNHTKKHCDGLLVFLMLSGNEAEHHDKLH